ncbi:MAG: hypothetical protein KGJ87_08850 [Planctomycetota bacterium]|nr:hypothetical protein [Planctomycetota bacterium]MDE2217249.1 hypothetical protein [Planctomycetota bacterium]
MKKILNLLGIALLIAITCLIYAKNADSPAKASNFVYERTFHSGYVILSTGPFGFVLSDCNKNLAHFKVTTDSAYLKFDNFEILKYVNLGVDSNNGLHLFGADSVHVVCFHRADPRYPENRDSSGLQMVFYRKNSFGQILLFPTKKCL